MKIRWLPFTICVAMATGVIFASIKLFDFVARTPADAGVTAEKNEMARALTPLRDAGPAPSPIPAALPTAEMARFQLVGVMLPGNPNSGSPGLALISIDGNPAQGFRVGDRLSSNQVVQAIQPRSVLIGQPGSAPWLSLELATPGLAANADLGAGLLGNGQAAMQPRLAQQLSAGHPPTFQLSGSQGTAPNVLLNNPADMAPADASGNGVSPSR